MRKRRYTPTYAAVLILLCGVVVASQSGTPAPNPAPTASPAPAPGAAESTPPEGEAAPASTPAPPPDCLARPFDPAERDTLLRLAWRTLAGHLTGQEIKDADLEGFDLTPCLMAPRGLFVTLKKADQVRGLQGEIEPTRPLYQQVIVFTRRAATRDARFLPLTERDLGSLTITLAAIGTRRPVSGPSEIHPESEGVFLEKWGRRALFLPGIAASQGWTPERTLDELCVQASLPKGAWKESARIEVFTADEITGGLPAEPAPSPSPEPAGTPAGAPAPHS